MNSACRRVKQLIGQEGLAGIEELQQKMTHDKDLADRLVRGLSINVTEMFRDPQFFLALRKQVIPLLRDLEHFKIWHAGCASGEEVYSMAIMLLEENLDERSMLFGTDFNCSILDRARQGILPLDQMQKNVMNYQQAGGRQQFVDYYHARYAGAALAQHLKQRILFSFHDLTRDNAFGEMNMVICRNVLIYFNKKLKERVLQLFYDSLVEGGILCLGSHETLKLSLLAEHFETINAEQKIYRKLRA